MSRNSRQKNEDRMSRSKSKDALNASKSKGRIGKACSMNLNNNKKMNVHSQNFIVKKVGEFDRDYEIKGELGQGSFGKVYRVLHKQLQVLRALKIVKKKQNQTFSSLEQIEVLSKLDHPNILKIHQFYETKTAYYIITQIFEGKQLFDEIVTSKLNESLAAAVIFEVLKALNYTHSKGFAHRDLKPENLMVRNLQNVKKLKLKIIDWGLGTLIGTQSADRLCGTVEYCAPEVLKGKYSISCDMWSLGVIAYIIQTGEMLFKGKNSEETLNIVRKGEFKPNSRACRNLSSESIQFMKDLLKKQATERMTAKEALEHPWITKNVNRNSEPQFLKETLERLKLFKTTNQLGVAVVTFINNHLCSAAQKEKLDAIFNYLDKNSDGSLSVEELIEGYSQLYGKNIGTKMAEQIFLKLDVNCNNTIDYSQFVAFGLKRQQQQSKIQLRQAFNLFDRNGDGKISWKEIGNILQGRIEGLSEELLMQIVAQIDQDGDNQIDFNQFIKCVQEIYNLVNQKQKTVKIKSSIGKINTKEKIVTQKNQQKTERRLSIRNKRTISK